MIQQLAQLEREGLYVFHGSGLRLPRLEPRQAFTVVDGKRLADGEPCVFASGFVDYAIFMAIINAENCPRGLTSSCSFEGENLVFGASASTLEQIDERSCGYVHVLRKSDFVQRNYSEWVSVTVVETVEIIQVARTNFMCAISLIADVEPT
ncbi:MAG: hypothetical protein K2Z81_24470 [Cyanobacteria bacterium]|nr:hypothetical protein [Cyanobacteriota bacterium]